MHLDSSTQTIILKYEVAVNVYPNKSHFLS